MRHLVTARVKSGEGPALAAAVEGQTLGNASVAGDEYLRDMAAAARSSKF